MRPEVNLYPWGQISMQRAGKMMVINLLNNYRSHIHELAVARKPSEAKDALMAAQKAINELEGHISDKEILDMRETVSVFYWKACRRISEGI